MARRYDEAVAQQLRTIELDPSFAPVYRNLGGSYEQLGRFAQRRQYAESRETRRVASDRLML